MDRSVEFRKLKVDFTILYALNSKIGFKTRVEKNGKE